MRDWSQSRYMPGAYKHGKYLDLYSITKTIFSYVVILFFSF